MKLKKHASTLVLVALACALGAYAWRDRASVSQSERATRPSNVFPAWRRDELTRIELEHGAGEAEKIVLLREPDDAGEPIWRMTSPRQENADAAMVDRFLGALEFATVVRKVDGALGERGGFDAPRARGLVAMGSIVYRFALGGQAPTPEGAAYFRMEGEPIVVVNGELGAELAKRADAFRTRTVVPYLSLDLQKLEVRGRASSFAVERVDGRTFVVGGSRVRASRERLNQVWRALGELRAKAFLGDDEGRRATADPEWTIAMTPKDGRAPGELAIGGACPGHPEDVVVVRRAPAPVVSACAPKGALDGLRVTPASLADTRVFTFEADEIEQVRLEAPGAQAIDVARKGTGWREIAPEGRDLPADVADAVSGLVADLARAEGEIAAGEGAGVAGDAAKGASETARDAAGKVTIVHAEKGDEESVRIGAGLVVRGDGAVLRVTPAVLRKLTPRVTALRPRALWNAPLAGRPVVALDTRCDGAAQHVSRDGDAWRLEVDGAPIAPDAATILGAVDHLSRARADAWVADADDGSFGLTDAARTCQVRLTYLEASGALRAVGITFGADGEGGTYARLDGDGAVLVAPASLRALVAPLFVERHALIVDPYAIHRVEVTRGGARRVFDPAAPDDGGAAVLDELAALVTDTVHLGPPRAGEGFGAPIDVTLRLLPDAGRADVRFAVGAEVARGGRKMRLVRAAGLDATLAVAAETMAHLLGP